MHPHLTFEPPECDTCRGTGRVADPLFPSQTRACTGQLPGEECYEGHLVVIACVECDEGVSRVELDGICSAGCNLCPYCRGVECLHRLTCASVLPDGTFAHGVAEVLLVVGAFVLWGVIASVMAGVMQ